LAEDGNHEQPKNLTFEQMTHLLCRLGFVPMNFSEESADGLILADLWKLLQGDKRNGVLIQSLRTMLLNIIGCRMVEKEKDAHEDK